MAEKPDKERFIDIVKANLPKDKIPNVDELDYSIETAAKAAPIFNIILSDEEVLQVKRSLSALYAVEVSFPTVLTNKEQEPWLERAKIDIDPFYWKRYQEYLLNTIGWPLQVAQNLDEETDRILMLSGNPNRTDSWDRRGLVMGYVQSGKTANYIGLICKAADAGYKTVIVIAGIQNNLRNQTQTRVDDGFTGYDSLKVNENVLTGVGLIPPPGSRRPFSLTNSKQDFDKTRRTLGTPLDSLKEPVVLVIKKNVRVLKNLHDWLKLNGLAAGRDQIDSPLLLIDDEADNASINIMYNKDEVSAINGAIRSILRLFNHSTYIGYTATPFANIFIDPATDDEMLKDDLFPRSFIVSLDAPTNYFSANKIFLDDQSHFIVHNEDALESLPLKHKIGDRLEKLPKTLCDAICCFVLATAIRFLRGQGHKHSSMMINMSRFVSVQKNIKEFVSRYLSDLVDSCKDYAMLPYREAQGDKNIRDLHDCYEKYYSETESTWDEVQQTLTTTIPEISVALVNSKSTDTLNYAEYPYGKKVIAIGGMALSRGLTLEGLVISYYLRNTVMYDTLIQMGRWFGYRIGYEDLCRIFMTTESEGHFTHISESIEELREEMKYMERQGATPAEFGLKVRSDPDSLVITSANKMGNSESLIWRVGLANQFLESRYLRREADALNANRELALKIARELLASQEPEKISEGFLFREVPYNLVESFFEAFKNSNKDILSDPRLIIEYLRTGKNSELAKWDVLFPSISDKQTDNRIMIDIGKNIHIRCQKRSVDEDATEKHGMLVHRKLRVASRPIEHVGLSVEDKELAEQEFRKEKKDDKTQIPDNIYRKRRSTPLLVIHFIDYQVNKTPGDEAGKPTVAWSLSLPDTTRKEPFVEYQINAVYAQQQQALFAEEIVDDEVDQDELE
jgi:hypothetical protein